MNILIYYKSLLLPIAQLTANATPSTIKPPIYNYTNRFSFNSVISPNKSQITSSTVRVASQPLPLSRDFSKSTSPAATTQARISISAASLTLARASFSRASYLLPAPLASPFRRSYLICPAQRLVQPAKPRGFAPRLPQPSFFVAPPRATFTRL